MNYYREMYYKYLNQKFHLMELLKHAHPKEHFIVVQNIHREVAILQIKIELCDERAMIEHKREISKNQLKQTA